MNQESTLADAPAVTAPSPRPFIEIPRLWLRVYSMDQTFLAAERPHACGTNTLFSVLFATATVILLSAFSSLLQAKADPANAVPAILWGVASALCNGLVGNLAGFYVTNGIILLGARLFGGRGDYGSQAYLYSLVAVPVTIMLALLMLFLSFLGKPYTSAPISFPFSIYALILWVRVVKVTHDLSTWAAIGAVFIPWLFLSAILGCILGVALGVAGPALEDVWGSIGNIPSWLSVYCPVSFYPSGAWERGLKAVN